jgi:hypothetical protein
MEKELKWQAFEYEHQTKSTDWFWIVWIIAIGIAVTAYLFKNLLFGMFILISAFSLSLYASRKPDLLNFALSERGFLIKGKLVPFSTIQSFWIEEDHPNSPKMNGQGKIILQSQTKTVPYIIIPLSEDIDSEEIREYLLKYLEEEEHHETLFQRLFEKLGF